MDNNIFIPPVNDDRLSKIPPWSGLNHFESLAATGEFADGTKFEDLSKVINFEPTNRLF